MRVVRLMGCEHCCHLIMVSWVDIFIDAVPSQLYLQRGQCYSLCSGAMPLKEAENLDQGVSGTIKKE